MKEVTTIRITQHAATRCNTLQRTATHCNTLHLEVGESDGDEGGHDDQNQKDQQQNTVERIELGHHTKCQVKRARYALKRAVYSNVNRTRSRMPFSE